MISVGGGFGLVVMVVVGAILSERRWLRILCWAYLALYAVALAVSFALGELESAELFVPSMPFVFALYVHEVKRFADGFK